MKCRYCGETLKKPFIHFDKMPIANGLRSKKKNIDKLFDLKVFFCKKCFLSQTEEVVAPKFIFSKNYPYQSSLSSTFLVHCKNYFNDLLKNYLINTKSFVIEIACNDGYMLNLFKKKNIPHLGIEPTNIYKYAKKNKINVIKEFFSYQLAKELSQKKISAELIISNNILAHVPDINDFIMGIKKLLKINGIAVFEFPHVLNMLKKNLFDTIYHEHYSYLSLVFLQKVFQKNKLKIFDIKKTKIHGGSLRVFVSNETAKYKKRKAVDTLINEEIKFGLTKISTYNNFKKNILQYKNDVLKKLAALKKNNFKIVGYGAAAKATTALNFLEIDYPTLSYIYDKSPEKHDKYIPGKNILIKEVKELRFDIFDYLLIFPWNIKKEIIKDVKKFRKKSIKVITLVPKFKVVTY